jgi:hypothetical protein
MVIAHFLMYEERLPQSLDNRRSIQRSTFARFARGNRGVWEELMKRSNSLTQRLDKALNFRRASRQIFQKKAGREVVNLA